MPFISSSEAKKAYFMSGKATNEIYFFVLHVIKLKQGFKRKTMSSKLQIESVSRLTALYCV